MSYLKLGPNPGTETFRIVIFIDDLDRCSPKRALEVFESVKVFLDVEGFIFVMGLSLTTMAKLVEKEYEGTDIKGRDYIRKIIQTPIFLPAWKVGDTISVIKDLIDGNRLGGAYANFIAERKDILATIIEPNPREIKRFINDFLITSELSELSEPKLDKEALILIRALQFRWDVFYEKFMSDGNFRSAIIAVSSLHVNLEYLNNYLNEEDFGRRGMMMSIMLYPTRRTLNIGQTEEELKEKMEANRRDIESAKRMWKDQEKSRKEKERDIQYIPLGSAKTLDEVREERNEARDQTEKFLRDDSERIKKLEEEYGEMQRRASEEESALRIEYGELE